MGLKPRLMERAFQNHIYIYVLLSPLIASFIMFFGHFLESISNSNILLTEVPWWNSAIFLVYMYRFSSRSLMAE